MKELWKELQTQVRVILAGALIAWLSLGGWALVRVAMGLSLTNHTILTTQLILLIVGLFLACLSGWMLFFQTRRKLQIALKRPHQFLDDFEHQTRLGLYKHKSKTGLFCGHCTPQGKLAPLQAKPHGWLCNVCEKYFPNPDSPELIR
jgi:hypothetical protein